MWILEIWQTTSWIGMLNILEECVASEVIGYEEDGVEKSKWSG